MRRAVVLLTLLLATTAAAEELEGVELPSTLTIEGQDLKLNGAGVRTKWTVSVYVGGLYLSQASTDPAAIIEADAPMAIRMHMVYDRLTGQQMTDAIAAGFDKSTGGNTEPFTDDLAMLLGSLERVGKDDVVDIYYLPGVGLGVMLNGVFRGSTDDFEFKKAVFGIWLGPDPVHKKLKGKMLGG